MPVSAVPQPDRRAVVPVADCTRSRLQWFRASLKSVQHLRSWAVEELAAMGVDTSALNAYEESLEELAINAAGNPDAPATIFGIHIYLDSSGINVDFLTDALSFLSQKDMACCMADGKGGTVDTAQLYSVTRHFPSARFESRLETRKDYERFHLNHDRRSPIPN